MGLAASSLTLWQRQARTRKESAAPGFAEVRLTEPIGAAAAVSIHLPGGATLEATVGADPMWLGQLIKAALSA